MKRFKKILIIAIVAIIVVIAGLYLILPKVVRCEINKKADYYGINVRPESIDIRTDRVILHKTSISSSFFPDQKAYFDTIIVKVNWFTPEKILITGGSVDLNGQLETLKEHIDEWRGRKNSSQSKSKSRSNLLDKLTVKNITITWQNWKPESKLEVQNASLNDGVITTGPVLVKTLRKNIEIDRTSYDLSQPREVYLGAIRLSTEAKESSKSTDSSTLTHVSIPRVPDELNKFMIYGDKFSTAYGKFDINLTNFKVLLVDMLGVVLIADEMSVNQVSLDKIDAKLIANIDDDTEIRFNATAKALRFAHRTLLDHEIEIEKPLANIRVVISDDRIEFQEGHIEINEVSFDLSGFYARHTGLLEGHVNMDQVHCQKLLDSIPLAMKPTIKKMKLRGTMQWEVYGGINFPSKSETSIRVKLDNRCEVISVPEELSISKLRKPFKRYAYNAKGELIEVETGPNTLEWTPIALTSQFVPIAIRTMEDPNFMVHRGFDIQAIENSIRDNIKEGRFAKGASTISMQLAKNLWLNRDKTISRKVQEAFLTIYLEQKLRKDEILQLYVNVVEFGPNIYGIGKASQYYFHNHPLNLSLGQSMFLASVLPKPKGFYFGANGQLSPGRLRMLHRSMKAMRDRRIITEDEYDQGIKEAIAFGKSSTGAEESDEIEIEDDGVNPDSWSTN